MVYDKDKADCDEEIKESKDKKDSPEKNNNFEFDRDPILTEQRLLTLPDSKNVKLSARRKTLLERSLSQKRSAANEKKLAANEKSDAGDISKD